jgi:hypothetical protein
MTLFGIGLLAGGVLTILLLALTLRLMNRAQLVQPPPALRGAPELTVTLTRDLLERLIDDSLANVALPLVTLRDPHLELEPDAVLVIRLRGDTALLGAQLIVLRMRMLPAAAGIAVQTESADVGILGNVAGPLTARLDATLNAELARRLAFAGQFEVLEVAGDRSEVTVRARLR